MILLAASLFAFDIVGLGSSAQAGLRFSLPFLGDGDEERIIEEADDRDGAWIPSEAIPSVPVTRPSPPTWKTPWAAATPTRKPAPTPRWKHHKPSTRPAPVESPDRPSTSAPAQSDRATEFERQVWQLVNAERTKHGCAALRYDSRIARAARLHSQDMAEHGYFEHDSRDGRSPWDRMRAQGYDAPGAENIAAGQRTPQEAVESWMNSSGHRANILDCDLKATGVGVAFGGDYGIYWTQDFGRE